MAPRENKALTAVRNRVAYTTAERELSLRLREYLNDVLTGRRQRLPLLRKYPGDPTRLGIIPTRDGMRHGVAELSRLEQLTWDAVRFLQVGGVGGPIAQRAAKDGGTLEIQTFPTRYPLVVVERVDHFPGNAGEPDAITWSVCRLGRVREDRAGLDLLMNVARVVFGVAELIS
jgi:hypothetical protein